MNYDEQSKKFYIKVLKYYLFEEGYIRRKPPQHYITKKYNEHACIYVYVYIC